MEYVDLNLMAIKSKQYLIIDALTDLIKRNTHEHKLSNDWFYFDENTLTLKIKDSKHHLHLANFQNESLVNHNSFTPVLRLAIKTLLTNNINICFKSNHGTFIPLIYDKQDNHGMIYLACDDSKIIVKPYTEITIYPVKPTVIKELKAKFAVLQNWQKVIYTEVGNILISTNNKHPNNFFLNGTNITKFVNTKIKINELKKDQYTNDYVANFLISNHPSCLFFSYDFKGYNPKFNDKVIKDKQLDPKIMQCIAKIYQKLNDYDKEYIFQQILNNFHSYEWKSPLTSRVVIKYLSLRNPDQYLLADYFPSELECEHENFVHFATLAHKQIIWWDEEPIYDYNEQFKIMTLWQFGQAYLDQHYKKQVAFKNLNPTALKNWRIFYNFLQYPHCEKCVSNHYSYCFECIEGDSAQLEFHIVKNLPNHQWSFSYHTFTFYIDEQMLLNSDFAEKMSLLVYFFTKWFNEEGFLGNYYGFLHDATRNLSEYKGRCQFDENKSNVNQTWHQRFTNLLKKRNIN